MMRARQRPAAAAIDPAGSRVARILARRDARRSILAMADSSGWSCTSQLRPQAKEVAFDLPAALDVVVHHVRHRDKHRAVVIERATHCSHRE
jgi:hypothetical protein